MKAINNNLILEKQTETSTYGIILTNNSNNIGKVISLDESITNIKIGDTVVYDEKQAFIFENNNKKYIVVNIKLAV